MYLSIVKILNALLNALRDGASETRFLTGVAGAVSIRGLRSAPVVAVPMSPGHRATSRALNRIIKVF